MTYEFDFEDIGLNDDQRRLVEMGMGNIDELNVKIRDLVNRKAKDGWEPLYPFVVPKVWFKRALKAKKK